MRDCAEERDQSRLPARWVFLRHLPGLGRRTEQQGSAGAQGVDSDGECEMQVLARLAPVVAGGWGIAGVAAGTALRRLKWEVGAVSAISTSLSTAVPVCVMPYEHAWCRNAFEVSWCGSRHGCMLC
jgi:hypothetical protein